MLKKIGFATAGILGVSVVGFAVYKYVLKPRSLKGSGKAGSSSKASKSAKASKSIRRK